MEDTNGQLWTFYLRFTKLSSGPLELLTKSLKEGDNAFDDVIEQTLQVSRIRFYILQLIEAN